MIGSAEQLYFVIKPHIVNVYNIGMLTNVLSHDTFLCLCKSFRFFRRERRHTVCDIEHIFLILPIYREFLICICVHFPNSVRFRLIVADQFIEIFIIEPYMIGSAEQLYFVIKPRMVNVYNIGMLTNVLSHYTFLCLCKSFRFHLLSYLIEFLHQTTTGNRRERANQRCILLSFYIKPQPSPIYTVARMCCILLSFYIKPQLTNITFTTKKGCILLSFYIKPQQFLSHTAAYHSCILLSFYIKPQP